MLRQSLLYLFLSILVVVFARYAHLLVVYIALFSTFIRVKLTPFFRPTDLGLLLRNILVLTSLPLFFAAIPSLSYRVIKGHDMPYFLMLTWIFWLILVLSTILVRG